MSETTGNPTPPPGNDPAAEIQRLREQLDVRTQERDAYLRLFMAERAKNQPEVTQADLDAAVPAGPWFSEFLRRLEAGDPNAIDAWPVRK